MLDGGLFSSGAHGCEALVDLADAFHLVNDFYQTLLLNLFIDHVSLGSCVLDPPVVLLLPRLSHLQIPSVQIVLRHFLVVVYDCIAIVLLRPLLRQESLRGLMRILP